MAKYATGKYAKAISDRSGMEFPYKEMVREWNGSFVHVSEFEPKQPQLEPKPMNGDSISLRHVRPGRNEPAVAALLKNNPFSITSGSQTITVTEPTLVSGSSTVGGNNSSRIQLKTKGEKVLVMEDWTDESWDDVTCSVNNGVDILLNKPS